eukprot:scaffold10755_cov123-Skeletonema_dohrnii-CCMP3373.AAC.9
MATLELVSCSTPTSLPSLINPPSSPSHFLASPLNNRKLTARTMALASPPPLRVDANRFIHACYALQKADALERCRVVVRTGTGSHHENDQVCYAVASQHVAQGKFSPLSSG